MKTLKTYECRMDNYFPDGSPLVEKQIAISPSKARYSFYQDLDSDDPYSEWFKAIKVRSLGVMKPSDLFGDFRTFIEVCQKRNIEFVRQGMMIDVDGKKGWITGANNSCNLDVLFEGQTFVSNCHPTWETTYYDNKGNIIKDFKETRK